MRVSLLLGLVLLTVPAYARGGGHGGGSHGTGASSGSHYVKGYTAKNGTYVKPHRQTNPDRTQKNNYSTKGNTNPWTGKKGTRNAAH
jgi:hypothetical protein